MTEYVRYGGGWGEPGTPGYSHDGVLVRAEDVVSLVHDLLLYGNVFLRPTGDEHEGEPVFERINPRDVLAA